MIKNLKGIVGILNKEQTKWFIYIVALSFLGMLFEVFGIGLLIPTLSAILDPDFATKYEFLGPVIDFLGNPDQAKLVSFILYAFIFYFLMKMVYMIWLTYKQSNFAASITDSIAESLFGGYIHLPYSYHLENNSAVLIRNIQSEVQNYTETIRTVLTLVLECLISLGIAIFLFVWQPVSTSAMGGSILVVILVFNRLTKKSVQTRGEQRQDAESKVTQHLIQGLGGIKEVKLMGKESYFLQKFHVYFNKKVFVIARQLAFVQVPRMMLEFLAVIGIVMVIFISISRNVPLDNLLTTVGVFLAAIFRMLPSLSRILSALQVLKFHEPVVGLLKKELKMVGEVPRVEYQGENLNFKKGLSLKEVSFSYTGDHNYALQRVSLDVGKGECIGIIGRSGSGKSTLIDLVLGLINPSNGKVLVDDADINSNMRGWQNLVGYVPQTIYLTDATIRENIAFGSSPEEIDDQMIRKVLKSAMLEEFIDMLPDKEFTMIGENGARISGGQRQRIGMARALYHNPELLVLDEATSALDNETEREVMKAVTALKGSRTIVIVAHRHSTLVECDRIYEFENGKIVRTGKPVELIDESN